MLPGHLAVIFLYSLEGAVGADSDVRRDILKLSFFGQVVDLLPISLLVTLDGSLAELPWTFYSGLLLEAIL